MNRLRFYGCLALLYSAEPILRNACVRHFHPRRFKLPRILLACSVGLLLRTATADTTARGENVWRVDRLGFFGPEHTNSGGGQSSRTYEAQAGGQIRYSLDPLAYITGISGKTINGQYYEDNWFYDIRRKKHTNVIEALSQLVPLSRSAWIDRVSPSGVAVGSVNFPNDIDPLKVLAATWRHEDGNFQIIQPPHPAGVPADGGRTVVNPNSLLTTSESFFGFTFFEDAQASYAWRSDHGVSRLVGFYDEPHRGMPEHHGIQLDRVNSSALDVSFGAPFSAYIVGTSARFDIKELAAHTAWIDDGQQTTRIGLYDGAHTAPGTDYQSSEIVATTKTGLIFGESNMYSRGAEGKTLWRYDLSTGQTKRLGLFDDTHTDPQSGVQDSRLAELKSYHYSQMNSSGQVIGISTSYSGAGFQGRSAWIADENDVTVIGLRDADTNPLEDRWLNTPVTINEQGHVLGVARRANWRSNEVPIGSEAAWIYDGSKTQRIGLYDAEHTRSTDGYQSIYVGGLAQTGVVSGFSPRYGQNGNSAGYSAWIFNGNETVHLGLTDSAHTDPQNGSQRSALQSLNSSGQAAGVSAAYGLPSSGPRENATAWFYDPHTGYQTLVFDINDASDRYGTQVMGLSDEGTIVGRYLQFDSDPINGSWRPFRWSARDGLVDIADFIEYQHPDLQLFDISLVDPETALKGQFLISAGFRQKSAPFYLGNALFLVTLVPEPSTMALLLAAVIWQGIRGARRRGACT